MESIVFPIVFSPLFQYASLPCDSVPMSTNMPSKTMNILLNKTKNRMRLCGTSSKQRATKKPLERVACHAIGAADCIRFSNRPRNCRRAIVFENHLNTLSFPDTTLQSMTFASKTSPSASNLLSSSTSMLTLRAVYCSVKSRLI